MKLKAILFCCMVLIARNACSQDTPKDLAKKFFSWYKTEGADQALDNLFSTNKYSKDIQESLDDLKLKLNKIIKISGPCFGYSLLTEKTAGPDLTMQIYLVKYERQPVIFRMLFYRPSTTWVLQNFMFDTKIDEELEEATKAYRYKENY